MTLGNVTGLLSTALFPPASPPRVAARRTMGRRAPAKAAFRIPVLARVPVLGEVLFRDALLRERQRAYRFDQRFVVLLVDLSDLPPGPYASNVMVATLRALGAAKRETDALGWVKRGAVLGLIMPEVDPADLAKLRALEARFRQEFATRLDGSALRRIALSISVPSGEPFATGDGLQPLEALFESGPVDARTTVRDRCKRGFDILGSMALLVGFAPALGLIAALVKWSSPGPVFYRQERVGAGGRHFRMVKFRSMYTNAGHAIHQQYVTEFINGGGAAAQAGADGPVFKITNDPRVTPLGSFLRKTSLDELPQFWNVLRGEMSLVGPRPPLPFEVEQYRPWHRRRVLEAKPGITGLWQVKGRSRTTFDEMVRLDLRYARQCSLWTDIKILAATPAAVIGGKGAC